MIKQCHAIVVVEANGLRVRVKVSRFRLGGFLLLPALEEKGRRGQFSQRRGVRLAAIRSTRRPSSSKWRRGSDSAPFVERLLR
jgi:hypothetical protein